MYLFARCLVVFLFLVSLFSGNGFSQSISASDEAAIKAVITQFFNLFPKKDSAAVEALWSVKSTFFRGHKQELDGIFSGAERIEVKNLAFGKIAVEGENVRVRATVEFSATEAKTGKPYQVYLSENRMITLVKVENGWKILRHISAERDLALRLLEMKSDEERNGLLSAENELINVNLAKALRSEGDRLEYEISPNELVEIYKLGLKIAEKVNDKNEILNALNEIGLAFSRLDKNKSLETYQKGIRLAEETGDKDLLARITGNVGVLYFDWGDFDKSLEYGQKSFAVAEEIGNKRVMAHNLGLIGNIYHVKGDYLKSLEYQQKALAVREEIQDFQGVMFSLNNIGLVEVAQGNYPQAIDYFQRSIKMSRDRGAVQFDNLGSTYKGQGDYARAMNAYQKALNLCEEFKSDECAIQVSLNTGDLYNLQGNYEQAAKYLHNALTISEKVGNKRGIASALGGLALNFQHRGQYEKALETRKKALALFEEMGMKLEIVNSLNEIGRIYSALGDYGQATGYFQKSLKLNESLGDNERMSSTFLSITAVQLSKGDYENALKSAEQAKIYFDKLIGAAENWKLYSTFAQAYQGLGQTQKARQNLEKAVSVIENQRTNVIGSEEERQRFFGSKITAYNLLINLLISQKDFDEAFAYAEKTKSRSLLEVLQNGKIDLSRVLTAPERELEQRLKNQLVSLNAQISKENAQKQPNKTHLADLQNQLQMKRLEFEDFQTRLFAAHPELKVQRGEMTPILLEEAAKLLPNNQSAFLEYVVSDDKAFLFALTKDAAQKVSLKVYPIEIKQKDLAQRTESFRSKLAKGDLDFAAESKDLYNLLLKPAQAQLKGKTNLIIVPDSVLWDLPFQALQPALNKYLIETSAVSYAPSLTALREMSRKNKNKTTSSATLLAFGNPSVGKETSDRIKQVFMSERLESLPEAERLVNSLKQMYGADQSKVFIGAEAREEIAKTESPKYRIVQFAAHGILNDASPMYSHIVLAQKQDNPNEDGLLEAWEMKDLELNADMVILSACQTARGRFASGEGVIGMSWALFIAGAPTTVASQWKVESSSTTELMLEFHRQLLTGKGISKAEALRRASLKLLKMPKYKHPSYWAGFVIVGDGF